VTKGERLVGEAALCALYLRGAPGDAAIAPIAPCSRRRWPLVADALRASCPDLQTLSDALRSRGLYDEAAVIGSPRVLERALDLCSCGRVLTFLDPRYPVGWTDALGAGAPPCAWVRGDLPLAAAVGVVGSRCLDSSDRAFGSAVGRLLMRTGRTLVSGGAVGADSVALDAALSCGGESRCVEIVPFGLEHAAPREGVCQLSVCEPWAPFSTGQAMERNALIYAYGRRTVVVRSRLRAGGTWHGAVDALRRRLGDLYVRARCGDAAAAALCALGGVGVSGVGQLPPLFERPVVPPQPDLFGALAVRGGTAGYGAG
jgi:hypothetical protein